MNVVAEYKNQLPTNSFDDEPDSQQDHGPTT